MTDPWARLPRTRRALEEGLDEGLHLGAQLHVALRGETAADVALGENRPGEPLRPDHLMLWLSSTKPVAAVAMAQLWEQGRLDLDDPVARHLPEFAAQGKEGITLRHLLTHTAGIRMLDTGWPAASNAEIVARIAASRPEPRWVPGRKAGYHLASSWFILGEVVHRLSGQPFDRYVREAIFLPLGMTDCWIGMPAERYREYEKEGRLGLLYNTEGAPPRPHSWTSEARLEGVHPGGNGYGPVRELARFYAMLLGRGRLDGKRILSPQAVEALTARHRVGLVDQTFKHELDWGLGFILDSKRYGVESVPYGYGRLCSTRTFGHSGYRSSTGFADPEAGLTVALVMNGTPSEADHERRIRAVLDAVYLDLGLDIGLDIGLG
ncbi:MAG TPA: serine hydrolase domain-containing protein [Thermoanaerobaculia bacterium]|nr:serine hydrolase domain-containing protein [Thermoanaerobaculia bacterium]